MGKLKLTAPQIEAIIDNYENAIILLANEQTYFICPAIGAYSKHDGIIQDLSKRYLMKNRPTSKLHPEFYNHQYYNPNGNIWFRDSCGKTIEQRVSHPEVRIQFLEKLIKQLKTEISNL